MAEIQSLARGLQILEHLGQEENGCSVNEIAALLGIDKGSASRLLQTLAVHGFVERDPLTRRFHPGPRLSYLASQRENRFSLAEQARPFLRTLVDRTGECAHLGVAYRGQVLYIAQIESPATLRVNATVGSLAPLYCTALGKALLFGGAAELPADLPGKTNRTLTDPLLLKANLESSRSRGFALDDEEYDMDVRCLASPVRDAHGRTIAALGVSGPAGRITDDSLSALGRVVVAVAADFSQKLGFPG
jgi:IclR family acetate operon transcriptional repressor